MPSPSYNLPLFQIQEPITLEDCRISRTTSYKLVCNQIARWHSTLPTAPAGFKVAFIVSAHNRIIAVAMFGRPSARHEEQETTMELTRYAIGPDAPKNLGSWGLARMREWIRGNMPDVDRLISYQDVSKHNGALYKADNWVFVQETTKKRSWTNRPGRKGTEVQHKIKWERRP